MKQLKDKVAFISGGGSGIGLGQAKAFARAGMKVAIADVRPDRLEAAVQWFAKERLTVLALPLDVTDRTAYSRVADEVERSLGPVQLLCNTAGVIQVGPIQEASYADWDWLLGVNLGGVINGIQSFVPRMVSRNLEAHVVVTASMSSFMTGPGFGAYCTTKFALRGLAECLREDLRTQGIGVSLLCPGGVNTNIHDAVLSRPAKYADSGYKADPARSAGLKEAIAAGMDPDDLAIPLLEAVRRNQFYVLPFPEYRERLVALHETIMAAVAKPEDDPSMQQRIEAESAAMRKVMARLGQ